MRTIPLLAFVLCAPGLVSAQRVGVPTTNLDNLSVDELFSVEVTSVDRKAQQMAKAPAAVFVLSAADIRRSGATCIPEALQLVPGLTVLQIDGRSWTVSVRGGARQYADRILVLIDGRSLYTPFFSGIVWDAIDVPLEDVEQIEVVRGPGAVMWGPNAVNGVINIITRKAGDTTEGRVSLGGGNALRTGVEAGYGAAPSEKLAWRVWGKFDYLAPAFGSPGYYEFTAAMVYQAPSIRNLDSGTARVGFRADGQPGERDRWMVAGDLFRTDRQDPLVTPVVYPWLMAQSQGHSDYTGGYLQGVWSHTTASGVESTFQLSYDRMDLDYMVIGGDLSNLRLNYESRRQMGERNELYWGVGYQEYWDATEHTPWINYTPARSRYGVGDLVARDEWEFIPGRLTGSGGLRLDYNTYRQLEFQPSLRLLYTPDARQSAWLAVSRAARAPNRVDRDFDEYGGTVRLDGLPNQLWMLGSKNMRSEVERSVEAGYRVQSGQRWSLDASFYWSYYERLRGLEGAMPALTFPGGVPTLNSTVYECNCGAGRTYGAELWATWQVRPGWRLRPSYSYQNEVRWLPSSASPKYFWDVALADPAHQGVLRSQHDLRRNLQLDLTVRARSRDTDLVHAPGVVLLDARLGWRPWHSGELSLTVRDLAGREVWEGPPELQTVAIPTRRTFVVKWTQQF